MSKEKEDIAGFVPQNEYQPDLEALVQYHTARVNAGNPFRVERKHTAIEIPKFKPEDRREQLDWEMREIERCKNGYDGLPGFFYWYINHTWIKHKSRGKIRPDFRASALALAKVIEEVFKTPGRGLVNIKRRQIGMSWFFAALNIWLCTFHKNFDIGMSSKGLIDSQNLFLKHKYVHRNCSPFMRAYVSTDRRDAMFFGRWQKAENKWRGNQSSIISVAPTPTGHAGNQYAALILDEAGETEDLMSLWANAEECLRAETIRVGTPLIFGTMGDTLKVGKGLMEFWTKAEDYDLTRFPLWGYNSLLMDDLGNDLIEDSIRWIIYQRKKNEGKSPIVRSKFLQKFPLTAEDAFLIISGTGISDPITRSAVYTKLLDNPPISVTGWMRPKIGSTPEFVPDPDGKIIIYEHPISTLKNAYVAANDPAEDDDVKKTRDSSNLSTAIMSRPLGTTGSKIVAEYTDRPVKLGTYYEQLALLLIYYNRTQCLIEMNKGGGRVKDYFEANQDYAKLLSLRPKGPNTVRGGFDMEIGIKKTPANHIQMVGLLESYWEHYKDLINSVRFVEECGKFGADHADDDLATAVGWCLMLLQADHRVATSISEQASQDPKTHLIKVNGRLEYVNNNFVLRPTVKSSNPLFNRHG